MRRGALWARQTDVRSPTPDTASSGLTLAFVCAASVLPAQESSVLTSWVWLWPGSVRQPPTLWW